MTFSFFIPGRPAPGGSKNAFVATRKDGSIVRGKYGRPVVNVTDAGGKRNKVWKHVVHVEGIAFMRGKALFSGPLDVELIHFLPRPKAHFGTGRNAETLKADAPRWHTFTPDALKFARATEDGLTGALWGDDSANVRITTEKRWCGPGEKSGCFVRVTLLD